MNDELVTILEKVRDAVDADGQQADSMEALLLEDPIAFAEQYRAYLSEEERARLGAPSLGSTM